MTIRYSPTILATEVYDSLLQVYWGQESVLERRVAKRDLYLAGYEVRDLFVLQMPPGPSLVVRLDHPMYADASMRAEFFFENHTFKWKLSWDTVSDWDGKPYPSETVACELAALQEDLAKWAPSFF
jgi:hypothetical protein